MHSPCSDGLLHPLGFSSADTGVLPGMSLNNGVFPSPEWEGLDCALDGACHFAATTVTSRSFT